MERESLLRAVVQLGREFRRRGMADHAFRLRLYYLAVKAGLTRGGPKATVDVKMNAEFILEWLRLLRVPPHHAHYPLRGRSEGCPKCGLAKDNGATSVHTVTTFPGGSKSRCGQCGTEWIVEDEPEWQTRMRGARRA